MGVIDLLLAHVNYLAVLVAAVINMIIGALWYSPVLLANPWMNLVGKKMDELKSQAATQGYIGAAIASLVTAYVLAVFISYTQASTITGGAITGLWLSVGFVATSFASSYLFEGRPTNLFLINWGYNLVSLVIMGALLAVWR